MSSDQPPNPALLPLEVVLRDCFVSELRDENIHQLFSERDQTFKKGYEFVWPAESADDYKIVKGCVQRCAQDKRFLSQRCEQGGHTWFPSEEPLWLRKATKTQEC